MVDGWELQETKLENGGKRQLQEGHKELQLNSIFGVSAYIKELYNY